MGIGEASGMFPIDSEMNDYNAEMLDKFSSIEAVKQYRWEVKKKFCREFFLQEITQDCLQKEGALLFRPKRKS